MKYYTAWIFTFLFLCIGSFSYAQLTRNNFSIGPRAGVNFSNVNHPDEAKVLTGFLAGVTSTYSINESSGITVDVLYSGEGFKIGKEEMNLNYLRIPVLYNVFFGQLGESFRPKVFAGPQAGFLLSAKAGGMDFKNEIKNFAFGIGAGVGFNYQLRDRMWLNTDLRSFFDLTDTQKNRPASADKSFIRNIQLSVGVAWGF